MGTWTEAHRLFKIAEEANEAFTAAVKGAFGENASEARYFPHGKRWRWTAKINLLSEAKRVAGAAYLDECAACRLKEEW